MRGSQSSLVGFLVKLLKIIIVSILFLYLIKDLFFGTPRTHPKDPCSDEYRDTERCNEIDTDQYEISM